MPDPRSFLADLTKFPAVDLATWRERVEAELGGHAIEDSLAARLPGGLDMTPLYSADSTTFEEPAPPGSFPFLRGDRTRGLAIGAWRIATEVFDAEASSAAAAAHRDVARGARLVWLRLDERIRCRGVGRPGTGVQLSGAADLGVVLRAIDSSGVAWVIDSGAAAGSTVRWLEELVDRGELSAAALVGGLGGDPLGTLVTEGALGVDLDQAWQELADAASWCLRQAPAMRAGLMSGIPWHEAGATPVDEVACALASGVEALRRLTAAGLTVEEAAGQLMFAFAVGCDIFLEIAKLRAARSLWARVVVACGGDHGAAAMCLHVRGAASSLTVRAPRLNLLRATAQGFAATAAGAWSLTLAPYDEPLGTASDKARRLALSTHHLLAEEAHLGRVVDPAGGSWYLEALSEQLARAAWDRFRVIESRGGLEPALLSGWLQGEVRRAAEEREQAVRTRREGIVGVSQFPNLEEKPPPENPSTGTGTGSAGRDAALAVEALPFRRRSRVFEELRQVSDRLAARRGARPEVALYTLGPRREHGPRLDFARALFAVGGVAAVVVDAGEEHEWPLADGVVICGADPRYSGEVPALAAELLGRGARRLFLAGNGGELKQSFRRSGVDTFLYQGCDLVEVLEPFLRDLEAS